MTDSQSPLDSLTPADAIAMADLSARVTQLQHDLAEADHAVEMLTASISLMLDRKKLGPLPNDPAVAAIRDVALAAIHLAECVATNHTKGKP